MPSEGHGIHRFCAYTVTPLCCGSLSKERHEYSVSIARFSRLRKFTQKRSFCSQRTFRKPTQAAQVALLLSSPLIAAPSEAVATEFTAGVVMEKMAGGERYTFVSGIVEGLAYARFIRDGKNEAGMKCVLDWFHGNNKVAMDDIEILFAKYPAYPPAPIVSTLAERKCPGK